MKNDTQKNSKPAPKPRPGQIAIPIKTARFVQNFEAPVGFRAGSALDACSSKHPGNSHTLDFYPESGIIRVTWHPPRQPAVTFLVPSHHCFFMAEFSGDDKPQTPKG